MEGNIFLYYSAFKIIHLCYKSPQIIIVGFSYHFTEKLGPVFHQLQKLKLNQSPFVIISVIGQELLASGHYSASVTMLEAALTIGTCSLKLRGSVFSALSSAYWGMGKIDGAITNMQHDLSVAKSLGRYLVGVVAHPRPVIN